MDRVDDDSSPQLMIKEDLELVECYENDEPVENLPEETLEDEEELPENKETLKLEEATTSAEPFKNGEAESENLPKEILPESILSDDLFKLDEDESMRESTLNSDLFKLDDDESMGNEDLLKAPQEFEKMAVESSNKIMNFIEFDAMSDFDVKLVVEKLCDDVVLAEEGEFVEKVTPGGLSIKVSKKIFDIALKLKSSPFSYIRLEPMPVFPARRLKEIIKRKNFADTSQNGSVDDESSEPSKKRSREDSEKPSAKHSLYKPKRMKCITETCKVCLFPMDKREFMPDGETFYCSTECIHKKVKQVRKTLTNRDQIFVTDRRGRLHANHVPDIDALEAFLLRRPNYEPCVRNSEEEQKQPCSVSEEESRSRVRKTIADEITKRCSFHDIDITEKKSKELSHQLEYDLFDFIKSVRVLRYRNWCKAFLKFLMNTGKVFLDKLISGTVMTSRLVRIPDNILDRELHKMDEIEAAAFEPSIESPSQSKESVINNNEVKPKIKSSFPFKFRAEPLAAKPTSHVKPLETGRSAVDDILGNINKDTTSKHMSHLYDANCEICKQKTQMETAMLDKMKKTKQDKEKERELRRTEVKGEGQPEKRRNDRNSKRKIDDSSKRRSSFDRSSDKRGFSDDDVSPGFADDNDFYEPPPPGHSPNHKAPASRQSSSLKRSPLRRSPLRRSPLRRSPIRNRRSPRRRSRSPRSPRLPRRSRFDNPIEPTSSNRKRRLSDSPPINSINSFIPLLRPQYSDDNVEPFRTAGIRFESWKQPDFRPNMQTPELEPILKMDDPHDQIVWNGIFDYPTRFKYRCEFSLVKNKSASIDLEKILPDSMKVHGLIDCNAVWIYLESLRNAPSKEIITLLMLPPTDDFEYDQYIEFYKQLDHEKRMTVIDCQKCVELKDIYLFTWPAWTPLHPSCNVGDGPGLSSQVQQSPNILAVVVKHAGQRFDQPLFIEKPPLRTKTPVNGTPSNSKNEKPSSMTKSTLLDDIPIVGKSPFDSIPDKSPYSIKSFSMENSVPEEKPSDNLSFEMSEPQPVPPPPPSPPPDDDMDMSEDEEGEIVSSSELLNSLPTLPPPPPPPNLGHLLIMNGRKIRSFGRTITSDLLTEPKRFEPMQRPERNFEPNFESNQERFESRPERNFEPNFGQNQERFESRPERNFEPNFGQNQRFEPRMSPEEDFEPNQRFESMDLPPRTPMMRGMPMRGGMPMRRPMLRGGPLNSGPGRMPPPLRGMPRGGPRPLIGGRPLNSNIIPPRQSPNGFQGARPNGFSGPRPNQNNFPGPRNQNDFPGPRQNDFPIERSNQEDFPGPRQNDFLPRNQNDFPNARPPMRGRGMPRQNGPPNGLGPMRGRMPPPIRRGGPRPPSLGSRPANPTNANLMPLGTRPRGFQGPPQRLPSLFNENSGPRRPPRMQRPNFYNSP